MKIFLNPNLDPFPFLPVLLVHIVKSEFLLPWARSVRLLMSSNKFWMKGIWVSTFDGCLLLQPSCSFNKSPTTVFCAFPTFWLVMTFCESVTLGLTLPSLHSCPALWTLQIQDEPYPLEFLNNPTVYCVRANYLIRISYMARFWGEVGGGAHLPWDRFPLRFFCTSSEKSCTSPWESW